jgi:type III pantothenate kinase
MLLTIDIGNSNISIGLFQEELLKSWRIETNVAKTADEYANSILALFKRDSLLLEDVSSVYIASVVPVLNEIFSLVFQQIFQKPIKILEEGDIPITDNLYNRQELGMDRLLNAFAGWKKYQEPLIIIDFGTAITFDVVGEEGSYLGGIIMPSIRIATEALSNKTAKLPKVDFQVPKKIIGRNTVESMHSGIFFGYIGMIDFCIEKIFNQQGTCLVVATGGDASLLKQYSKIDKMENELTLWGMYFVYQAIKSKK